MLHKPQRHTACKNGKVDYLHIAAIKLIKKKQFIYLFPIIFKGYYFCEYVKFEAILWTIVILSKPLN